MGLTNSQKLRSRKKKARENRIKKTHHLQQNAAAKRYRLDVMLDGGWKYAVRTWAHLYNVEAHQKDTEARRSKGEEIIAGRVVDLRTGKVVMEIPASKPKGMAPDKIEDGPKAEEPKPLEKPIVSQNCEEISGNTGVGDGGDLGAGITGTQGEPKKKKNWLHILGRNR